MTHLHAVCQRGQRSIWTCTLSSGLWSVAHCFGRFSQWQNVYIYHGFQIAGCIMAFRLASIMKHLPPSSITHTSSRIFWSFRTLHPVPSACREHPPSRLYRWSRCCAETERFCHTTVGVGSRNPVSDTQSRRIIILGACKLRSQRRCLRQRKAM